MRHSVLVIEDDNTLRELIKDLFLHEDYCADTARHGKEAEKLLDNNEYDLVITDILLPEKDGLETIMHIRSRYPDIKIIAISGGGSIMAEDYLKIARLMGAHRAIEKPFFMETLLGAANEVLCLNETVSY